MESAAAPGPKNDASPRGQRRLPALPKPTAAFGLTDCHRLLVREFGESTPSLITLKRHAAVGELKALEAPRHGSKRPLYIYARVREHYQARIRKPQTPPPPAPALGDAQLAALVSQTVSTALEPIGQALQGALTGMREQLAQLSREVAGLAAVRQSLMLKYDAAASAAHSRADQLQEQLRESRKLQDVDTQLRRVLIELSRLQGAITPTPPDSGQA